MFKHRLIFSLVLSWSAQIVQAQLVGGTYTIYPIDANSGGGRATGGNCVATISAGQITGTFNSSGGPYAGMYGFEPGSLTAPLVDLATWKSVRSHGNGIGEKAIPLDPEGLNLPVIETRLGGVQKVLVDFDPAVPVRLIAGKTLGVDVFNGQSHESRTPKSESLTNGYTRLTVQFDPDVVGDMVRLTRDLMERLASPSGLLPDDDTDCQVRCLVGDVNRDGTVNMIDVGSVKAKNRQPVTDSNFWYDANVDGRLNLVDVALVKSRSGNSAP